MGEDEVLEEAIVEEVVVDVTAIADAVTSTVCTNCGDSGRECSVCGAGKQVD